MRKEGDERRTEMLRKLVHVGSGSLALLLGVLTWQQALMLALGAFAFNLIVLPRIGGRAMHRDHEKARGWAFGILVYPLSVAVLIIAFRDRLELAAAGWALMAFGDGMASVTGTLVGKHRLPWNPKKSWEGIAAFIVFGVGIGLPIAALVATMRGSVNGVAPLAVALVVAAIVTAFAESMDSGIDDNIVVPLLGAGLTWVALRVATSHPTSAEISEAYSVGILAFCACALVAVAAVILGTLTPAGGVAAAILGTIVATFGGWMAFAWLCSFFVVGVVATRLGRRVKEARGIAQSHGGRRGVGNVIANGGVAGLLVLAGWPDFFVPMWVLLPFLAALATAGFDTVSSEIGKAFGRHAFLATTFRRVAPGTEGAVSLEGTLAGLLGAALVVLLPVLPFLFPVDLDRMTARWGIHHGLALLVLVVVAAFIGSTFESIVGALCHARGHVIDNDALNFSNTAVGAVAMACLAPLANSWAPPW